MAPTNDVLLDREAIKQWAVAMLIQHGAAFECERHSCLVDKADGGALHEALEAAKARPIPGVKPGEVEQVLQDTLDGMDMECDGCASA